MTAQIALWLLSTIGALAFFGLGWVSSVMRKPALQAAGAPALSLEAPADDTARRRAEEAEAKVRAELAAQVATFRALEAERNALQAALEQARKQTGEHTALERALEEARARAVDRDQIARALDAERRKQSESAGLSDQLEAATRRHEQDRRVWQEQTRAEADKLHKQIAVLRSEGTKQTAVKKELDQTKAELAKARVEMDKLRASSSKGAAAATAMATATAELEQLRAKLRNAESAASKGEALRAELRDVRVQLETEKNRAKDLDRLREEVAGLREQSRMASGAKEEVTQLGSALQTARMELAQAQKRVEDMDREREEHRAVREENERLRVEVAHAADVEAEGRALRQKAQAAEARGVEAEDLREQNMELRDRLRELERFAEDGKQLEVIDGELRAAKLDNEMLRRRIAELGADSESRMSLVQKLEEVTGRALEADALQKRVDALEARLFALDDSAEPDVKSQRSTEGHHESALEDGPNALLRSGARISVLADNAGLLLASAGPTEHHEGLAALAGLALEFAGRVTALLPVNGIRWVQVLDERDMAIYWSLFDSHGDRYALSGLGQAVPGEDVLNKAVGRAQDAVDRAGGFA
jgi:hypothetical protein